MNEQMITEGPVYMQTGWICPRCGSTVSPNMMSCPKCSTNIIINTKGDNISTTWDNNNLTSNEQMICS